MEFEMKRLHIHLPIVDLEQNILFYTSLFGCKPTVRQERSAKWVLDDPRINFMISNCCVLPESQKINIQTEDNQESQVIKWCLRPTQQPDDAKEADSCCCMGSNKYWVTDPQGIAWDFRNVDR